eukprot:2437312-Rhodomonas_salina.5
MPGTDLETAGISLRAPYDMSGTPAGGDGSLKLWGGKRGKELMQFAGCDGRPMRWPVLTHRSCCVLLAYGVLQREPSAMSGTDRRTRAFLVLRHDDGISACAFSPVVGDRKGSQSPIILRTPVLTRGTRPITLRTPVLTCHCTALGMALRARYAMSGTNRSYAVPGGILTGSLLDGTYRLWNSLTGQEAMRIVQRFGYAVSGTHLGYAATRRRTSGIRAPASRDPSPYELLSCALATRCPVLTSAMLLPAVRPSA